MLNRKQFLWSAAVAGVPVAASAQQDKADYLRVEILPSEIRPAESGRMADRIRLIQLRPAPGHLTVVLRNQSFETLRIWDEDNSWGFHNLTLEISAMDGKTLEKPIIVKRSPVGWGGNAPKFSSLYPGDYVARPIVLTDPTDSAPSPFSYRDFPLPPDTRTRELRLRAIYTVSSQEAAEKHKVWTGEAASEPTTYVVKWDSIRK